MLCADRSQAQLRPYLPPPHTGKANLTRALGTGLRSQKIPMGAGRMGPGQRTYSNFIHGIRSLPVRIPA
jgi:hypothetical protein